MADRLALVIGGRAVVDGRLTTATPMPAATQVGVELFEDLRGDLHDRDVAKRRLDRAANVAAVAVECGPWHLSSPRTQFYLQSFCPSLIN